MTSGSQNRLPSHRHRHHRRGRREHASASVPPSSRINHQRGLREACPRIETQIKSNQKGGDRHGEIIERLRFAEGAPSPAANVGVRSLFTQPQPGTRRLFMRDSKSLKAGSLNIYWSIFQIILINAAVATTGGR